MVYNNRAVLNPHVIAESGCQVNSSGVLYKKSTVTTVEKCVVIINKYEELRAFDGTKNVSIRTIANDVKVDWHTAKKIHLVSRVRSGVRGNGYGSFSGF